jgi:colanic acid/amylovoran biosynthesis glycosyltransferase
LLVLASTLPARSGDGTPAFVSDLARVESTGFDTVVLAPLVPGGSRRETRDGVELRRYRFFPRRWEDLADGAILENLRARPSRWLQVPSFFLAGALAVRRAVRETAPDVVHVHWIIPQGLMALLAARGVPWLVTTLGGDLYALTSGPARLLKRQVLRRASAVTVMNEEMRQVVVGLGVPAEKVRVLPMGVELGRIQRSPVERVRGRLVFVGRLVEKKGVEILLQALQQLPAELDWSLDLVGGGPLREALEEQARPLGDRVTFLGQQSAADLAGLLARAEVAVFPSVRARSGDQDGLPVALLEAMAAGTPIVASDLPGLADAVAGGDDGAALPPAGELVEPGDASGLAAAISTLLGNREARERMGAAAVDRAATYSMDAIGARYVALLQDAIGTSPAGREGERR